MRPAFPRAAALGKADLQAPSQLLGRRSVSFQGGMMHPHSRSLFAAFVLVAAAFPLAAQKPAASSAPDMPPGHGIKCAKADGKTPCTDDEVAALNKDIADAKQTYNDATGAVNDTKQTPSDAKQVGSDAKQLGTDAAHPVANAKEIPKDVKTAVTDTKQAYSDPGTVKSDVQQVAQDAKQDVQDVGKSLKGIKALFLKAPDGSLACKQEDESACNDDQTKALKTHAATKTPPVTVTREVDQPGR
jgi:hypothetical protein